MQDKLKIAVFIDYDNIEIGVKSTLKGEFNVGVVLDALKERGDIVAKFAYADWGRQEQAKRQMAENAVQMVQRVISPRGDKNGADINLALDALEMAFTHDHINAFAIVSGDSDFIPLVNKLKMYGKTVFVVGGRAFTSTILQKNCHEFISFESLLDSEPVREQREKTAARPPRPPRPRPEPLELGQAMPLVERALQALERRGAKPQLGLLKSTMLQLDPAFSEKAYGASTFTDFVEKLKAAGYVNVSGAEGRYFIERKPAAQPERPPLKPEEALPLLRDVLETHRLEMDNGALADDLAAWVAQEHPDFDCKQYGFQEFAELLNYAQDKLLVRIQPDEEKGLMVFLGAEFYPPADAEVVPAEPVLQFAEAVAAAKPARKTRRSRTKADAGETPARKTARSPRRKRQAAPAQS
jgi:uncharacterized protein (TIGR00288 family)